MDLSKAIESVKSVKLQGGIFGKSSLIVVVLAISISSICIAIRNVWLALILGVLLLGMVFYTVKRCLDFAEKNPHAAIMDGAELLIHEQLQLGMKGVGEIPRDINKQVPDHPEIQIDAIEANIPDPPPVEKSSSLDSQDIEEVENG